MTAALLGSLGFACVLVLCGSFMRAPELIRRLEAQRRLHSITGARGSSIARADVWRRAPVVVGAGATLVAFLGSGVVLAIVVGAIATLSVLHLRNLRRHRAAERYECALPFALDAMARSFRSGAGLKAALHEAGALDGSPVAADFAAIEREVGLGMPVSEALARWSDRVDVPSVRMCAASLEIALVSGGSYARAVDGAAATLRQSLRARSLARMHATQSRSSATALTVLPIVVTGSMAIISAQTRAFLFHQPLGLIVLALGIALDAAGAFVMSSMIKRALT